MKRIFLLLILVSVFPFVSCDTENDKSDSTSGLLLWEATRQYPIPPPCTPVTYGTPAADVSPLHVDGRWLKDDADRIVILRGVNVAGNSKVPDFMPVTAAALLDPLPGWGFNTIRLLFTWEAFESTRCTFDTAYLDYYEHVVEWAADRGLYVLVDFHQDAYSRYSLDGCGDGFPEWAVTPAVKPATPDNGAACSSWGIKMILSGALKKTWKDFHADTYGARTRYLDMVEAVAYRMAGHANVIGYDLVNEPMGSDGELSSLFGLVAAKIRGMHPGAVLFVPPNALVSSGMVNNTMSKPAFDNFTYSPHYYDGSVTIQKSWSGNSPAGPLNAMLAKAGDWGAPMVLSELGGPAGAGDIEGYIAALYDWLDGNFVSGIHWCYTPGWNAVTKDGWNMEDFSIVDNTGSLRANFTPRPYPRKINGTPVSFSVDANGFTMTWNNASTSGTTEIFLPVDYESDKTLLYTLPGGATGSCTIGSQAVTCTVVGVGNVQVTLTK